MGIRIMCSLGSRRTCVKIFGNFEWLWVF